MNTCSVSECGRGVYAYGLCINHNRRRRLYGDPTATFQRPTLLDRFWTRVTKNDEGCWLWTGTLTGAGYGQIRLRKKAIYAHRLAWEIENGPIPEGMLIDHICHNARCVRPDHLRLATHKQNEENRKSANRTSSTGVRGVGRTKQGRWTATVGHNGQRHYAGSFPTLDEAERAVTDLRRRLFSHV